jgi:cytochrome P450
MQEVASPPEPTLAKDMLAMAARMYDEALNGDTIDFLPAVRRLRETGPVAWGKGHAFGDLSIPPVFQRIQDLDTALVMDFDDVSRVLRDEDDFIQDCYADMGGDTLIHLNGGPHQRLRRLLVPTLGPRAIRAWEEEFVGEVLDSLLAPLRSCATAELFTAVCNPYPVRVFRRIMDLPEEDTDKVHAMGVLQIAASASQEARQYTSFLTDYLRGKLHERRALPAEALAGRKDLISLIAAAGDDNDRLTEGEAVATLQLLVAGGVDTTANLLANLLCFLLNNPAVLALVRADRGLIPRAIEETLRICPSGGNFELRLARRDTEIQGVPIPKGTPVFTCETTANRDPQYWSDPDTWDPTRQPRPHLGFGQGPHTCIGMHLARMEVRVALGRILDEFPGLRSDPDHPPPAIRGFMFQHPPTLPVRLDEGA